MFDIAVNPDDFEKWMHEEAKAGRGLLIIVEHQPYSKANSRRPVAGVSKAGKKFTRFIKSENGMSFDAIAKASKVLYGHKPPLEGDVAAYALLVYRNRRPDVDESLLLDSIQGAAYLNDRQVRYKFIAGSIDAERPRAVILVKQVRSGLDRAVPKKPMARRIVADTV